MKRRVYVVYLNTFVLESILIFSFQRFFLVSKPETLLPCLNVPHLKGSDEVGLEKTTDQDLHSGSVAKTLHSHAGGLGSILGQELHPTGHSKEFTYHS